MNKSLDMPEMFITDMSHNCLSIASQNYVMGEQKQNPAFLFSSALSKQKGVCSVWQIFSYSKPIFPMFNSLVLGLNKYSSAKKRLIDKIFYKDKTQTCLSSSRRY